jgi:enamine deaminase RidA (YjgF/YER057c/UK114 family)
MRRSTSFLLLTALTGCAHPGESASPPAFLNPAGLAKGPGYSHLVDVPAGRTLYVSGQIPLDAEGKLVGPGDPRAQAEQVFRNLRTALESAGAGPADVVKLGFYIRDISHIPVFREVRDQFLGSGPRPASTLVEVKSLPRDDILIEVDAIAAPRGSAQR